MNTLFLLVVSIFVAISGFLFGNYTRRHPEYFWRYLLIGCLATTPLAIGGFTLYEELFAGFYLLANLPIRLTKLNKFHYLIFVLFILYMIFQSFRGMINFLEFGQIEESIRKIRWPIFFLILLGLFYKINNSKIRNLIDKDLAFKVTVFGLIFHIIYNISGAVAFVKGGSTAYTQYVQAATYNPSLILLAIWTPTAYVSSILPIIIPAVLMTLLDSSSKRRMIGWITLFVLAITVFFFNSRSGSVCLFVLTIVFIRKLRIRKIAGVLFLGILIFIAIIFIANIRGTISVNDFFSDLKRTLLLEDEDKYNIELQDINRKIWMYSAYPALTANPIKFLFGYGFRMSGYVVAPYVYEMFASYGIAKEYTEKVSTEAITNIAVDSGTIGLALLVLLFILTGGGIYKQGGNNRWLLIASLGLMFAWLFIINIVDSFLLYLILMPSGILIQLNKVNLPPPKK